MPTQIQVKEFLKGLPAWTPLVIVLFVGLFVLLLSSGDDGEAGVYSRTGEALQYDEEYYIWVSHVELYPLDTNKKRWDNNRTAPDIYYQIYWQDNMVHESEERSDSLIAYWMCWGVDLKDELLNLMIGKESRYSIDEIITVPIVVSYKDIPVVISIYDDDSLKGTDFAGTHICNLDDPETCHIGENVFKKEFSKDNAIRKMTLMIVPKNDIIHYLKTEYIKLLQSTQ